MLLLTIVVFLTAAGIVAAQPSVVIKAPDKVLIGEKFSFTVEFSTGATGCALCRCAAAAFGIDGNAAGGNCDGISNSVDAKMVGVNGGPITLKTYRQTANCVATPPTFAAPHPYGPNVPTVTIPAGWQLLTIELPFGSFTNTQPPVSIEIEALVSNLADVDPTGGNAADLPIFARGGFRYGLTPLNESTDPVLYSAGGGGNERHCVAD
ncbi:MAG: hypothetical protein IPJ30_06825 [Acidobacteria bacterium]|nr:hypothetical protein [Acidobacteriota bacterium]